MVFDEGPVSQTEAVGDYGPYIQTQRKEIYDTFVKHLVAQGKAYPCFCTPEELEAIRAQQEREKEPIIGYWGKYAKYRELDPAEAARRIESGEPYVVRLKSFSDPTRKETFRDEIKGKADGAGELPGHCYYEGRRLPPLIISPTLWMIR